MKTKTFFLYIAGVAAALYVLLAYGQALNHALNPSTTPLHSLSYQFQELKDVFKTVPYAGYLTDKNTDDTVVIAQYEQAQYVLAPSVLILNKSDYPLLILDYSSPQTALTKIKELGLQPIKVNNRTGLILALNPKAVHS